MDIDRAVTASLPDPVKTSCTDTWVLRVLGLADILNPCTDRPATAPSVRAQFPRLL